MWAGIMLTGFSMVAMRTVVMMMLVKYTLGSKDCLVFRMLLNILWQAATTDMLVEANHTMRALHDPLQVMRNH